LKGTPETFAKTKYTKIGEINAKFSQSLRLEKAKIEAPNHKMI